MTGRSRELNPSGFVCVYTCGPPTITVTPYSSLRRRLATDTPVDPLQISSDSPVPWILTRDDKHSGDSGDDDEGSHKKGSDDIGKSTMLGISHGQPCKNRSLAETLAKRDQFRRKS